ncbi:MAG: LON peptidase substrate-binding domain-containing protein [Pseudomonadales bacterium]|nr:LON peptidase substrate-binding domain-containing protein [Pseudomonadales bacterium]MDP7597359.1 LON peptidase substrate-binding domain-containing protein [Pseudomonadales bacterium]HJN51500.1 LON peptidase substrate-binding domain-containing protein [Pseudomonadales bacterium]
MSANIDVALFPIPNMVAFPGTVVPLHVFEPRYRQLVRDCVRDDRMVGVTHTKKTIREAKRNQTAEEALSSNQATYQPQEIFSAGDCEIKETTADGRILAEITMRQRLAIIDDVQTLPYRIVSCEVLQDETSSEQLPANSDLQTLINAKLITLMGSQNPDLYSLLQDDSWRSLSTEEFSFKLFQFLRFDPDLMQNILETRSTNQRLTIVWELLSQGRL